ncbi:putative immunity protein [Nocardioides sp. CFH 31398]|uniref:putative immunity protein n=1 Tax=Nocardioides sp. CFH 31398 TaxID=2919579 RepID=UPI001F06CE45|nr:hypothetical protein [Nocardioides sp. CFH 31398]MCH1868060.1 hypothetical protein [Nocardioides sp. CFH 31398]
MAHAPDHPGAWADVERLLTVADHRTVVRWSWEVASRAVARFAPPGQEDPRLARALTHVRAFLDTGVLDEVSHQSVVVGAHNAARALPDRTGVRASARAVGAMVATLRTPEHAPGVAMYGAMAARDVAAPLQPPDVAAAAAERVVQRDRLAELLGYPAWEPPPGPDPTPDEGVDDATWSPQTARAPESPTR